jgi:hypothetical protein
MKSAGLCSISIFVPFRALRPEKRWGLGARHALFPRSLAFGAPSFTRRVLLAVSFPTLRWSARTIAIPSGSAAEPASGVATSGLLGETSQPGLHTLASVLRPDPVQMLLRTSASSPFPQGRHRTAASSFITIVGLAPRVLSLTPQVTFSFSIWTTPLEPPTNRILLRFRSQSWPPRTFSSDHSIRGVPFPFFSVRLRHRTNSAAGLFVQNRRVANHHTGSQ